MENFVDLKGKTILVTGGSRGIGAELVRGLVAQGAHVVLNYSTSKTQANAIVDELGAQSCLPVQANIGELKELQRLWDEAIAWRERIDIVVNNAATRKAVDMDAEAADWDACWVEAFRVNLLATAHLSRLAVNHFLTQGGGSIIGITGRIAVRGDRPAFFHDGAMKGGMNSLLRGMARAYAKDNIQTYLICVGVVKTEQAAEMTEIYGEDSLLADIPVGALGTPEDVANAVVMCASGKLSYSTGCTIDVVGASFLH